MESPTSPQNIVADESFHFHTPGHASTPVQPTSRGRKLGLPRYSPPRHLPTVISLTDLRNFKNTTHKNGYECMVSRTLLLAMGNAMRCRHILRFPNLPHLFSIFMFVLPL